MDIGKLFLMKKQESLSVQNNMKKTEPTDLTGKALNYAMIKHIKQKRDGGEPYIIHPIQTAEILMTITDDEKLIAAGYLHDVIEDCEVTYEELKKEFGKDVADLVMEVTKEKPDKKTASYFQRLKTQRGIMLKFADRLSNLSDLRLWTDEKKQWYFDTSKFWRDSAVDPIYNRFKKRPKNGIVKTK